MKHIPVAAMDMLQETFFSKSWIINEKSPSTLRVIGEQILQTACDERKTRKKEKLFKTAGMFIIYRMNRTVTSFRE